MKESTAAGSAGRKRMATPDELDDQAWILAALDRLERPLIAHNARILGGDVERARDAVQEAFLRLCKQARAEVEPRITEWLFTVSRSVALDLRRKERRMEGIDVEHSAL